MSAIIKASILSRATKWSLLSYSVNRIFLFWGSEPFTPNEILLLCAKPSPVPLAEWVAILAASYCLESELKRELGSVVTPRWPVNKTKFNTKKWIYFLYRKNKILQIKNFWERQFFFIITIHDYGPFGYEPKISTTPETCQNLQQVIS